MTSFHLFRPNWKNKRIIEVDFYVKGWAEHEQIVYDAGKLLDLVADTFNAFEINQLKAFTHHLNGNFTILIHSKDATYLCSDKMRCFPVMYFQYDSAEYVTDDIDAFLHQCPEVKLNISTPVIEQYLCSNFVFGPYTIYEHVYCVQPGEIVELVNGKYFRYPYFQRAPKMDNDSPRDISLESAVLDAIFLKATERMIKSAPHVHNWIIPLSGGHDSRMIANYFYKLGVKNVICYTYGIKGSETISEKVAEALGYAWHYIEYTADIARETLQNKALDIYRRYAFNGVSVPHLQDFIAVNCLIKKGIVQSEDIFVPGHALEVLTGSHLKNNVERCDSVQSALFFIKHHFNGFGYARRSDNLLNHVLSIIEKYNIKANQISEYFDWQERQSKFIVNSVRVYEYFGFDWRIPQWDNEVVNYWENIGFNYRYGRKLYFAIEKDFLLVDELKNIPFSNDIKAKVPVKTRIASLMPLRLKKMLRQAGYKKSDYFDSNGNHLFYFHLQESIKDYQAGFLMPAILKKYLSHYPKGTKLCSFESNSISTLLIIKSLFNNK